MSETQQPLISTYDWKSPPQADDDTIRIISTYDWQSERDGTKTRVHIGKDWADAADAYFYAIEVKGTKDCLQWSEHFPTDYLAHNAGIRAQSEAACRQADPVASIATEREAGRGSIQAESEVSAQRRAHEAQMRRSNERVR